MARIVEAEVRYVTFGSKVHRQITYDGVSQTGTARCLVDDAFAGEPRYVGAPSPSTDRGDGLPNGFDDSLLCLHCFPHGEHAHRRPRTGVPLAPGR